MVESDTSGLIHPLAWHGSAWSSLLGALNKNHLAHGLLIYGHNGVGKLHLAKALAHLLLCSSSEAGRACGQCNSCLLNSAGTHPDLFFAQPEQAGKAIKVDLIRELNHFVSQTSQMSGRKVVVIEPADAMNINSSNALLKTLEEPAGDTHLILVVDSLSSLMPTIRSRCQYYELQPPKRDEARSFLAERYPDRTDHDVLIDIAEGGPFYAVELIENGKLEWRSLLSSGLVDVLKGKSTVEVAESWRAIDLMDALYWLDNWIKDMVILVMTKDESRIKNKDLSELMGLVLQKSVDPRFLHRYREILQATERAAIESHPNKQLAFDRLLIDWCKMISM